MDLDKLMSDYPRTPENMAIDYHTHVMHMQYLELCIDHENEKEVEEFMHDMVFEAEKRGIMVETWGVSGENTIKDWILEIKLSLNDIKRLIFKRVKEWLKTKI